MPGTARSGRMNARTVSATLGSPVNNSEGNPGFPPKPPFLSNHPHPNPPPEGIGPSAIMSAATSVARLGCRPCRLQGRRWPARPAGWLHAESGRVSRVELSFPLCRVTSHRGVARRWDRRGCTAREVQGGPRVSLFVVHRATPGGAGGRVGWGWFEEGGDTEGNSVSLFACSGHPWRGRGTFERFDHSDRKPPPIDHIVCDRMFG